MKNHEQHELEDNKGATSKITKKTKLWEEREQLLKSGLGVDLPNDDDMEDDLSTAEQQTTDNNAILTDHMENLNKDVFTGELEARLILEEHGLQLTDTVAPVFFKQLYNTEKLKFEIQYNCMNTTVEIEKLINLKRVKEIAEEIIIVKKDEFMKCRNGRERSPPSRSASREARRRPPGN